MERTLCRGNIALTKRFFLSYALNILLEAFVKLSIE